VTPLYPQKLALTSPTGGGRSVGIVRSRTKATDFSLVFYMPPALRYSFIVPHDAFMYCTQSIEQQRLFP